MRIFRSRRGVGLVDVLVTLFILGICGVVFCATFAPGYSAGKQGQQNKVATAIALKKMEQVRALNYESLTYTSLYPHMIDATPNSSPYSFTGLDGLAGKLPNGQGTLEISDISGTELKKVVITVTWDGQTPGTQRSVKLSTQFADRRPRPGS